MARFPDESTLNSRHMKLHPKPKITYPLDSSSLFLRLKEAHCLMVASLTHNQMNKLHEKLDTCRKANEINAFPILMKS